MGRAVQEAAGTWSGQIYSGWSRYAQSVRRRTQNPQCPPVPTHGTTDTMLNSEQILNLSYTEADLMGDELGELAEKLFELFCRQEEISYQRIAEGEQKAADYLIQLGGQEVAVEAKGVSESDESRRAREEQERTGKPQELWPKVGDGESRGWRIVGVTNLPHLQGGVIRHDGEYRKVSMTLRPLWLAFREPWVARMVFCAPRRGC